MNIDNQSKYDNDEAKLKQFLAEVQALCDKYGASIESCGCCSSIWVNVGSAGVDSQSWAPTKPEEEEGT